MNIKNIMILNRLFGNKVVHVEAPHLTKNKLLEHIKKYKSKCYCICPVNYDFVKAEYWLDIDKKTYAKFLKDFYLKLKAEGADLQPHVHLTQISGALPKKIREERIKKAYSFFKNELGITPKEMAFGWYQYDDFSEQLVKKMNMKIILPHYHIYDWWLL